MNGGYFKQVLCTVLGAILISISSIAWTSPAQADTFSCYERDSSERCAKPRLVLDESCGSSNSKFECCKGNKKDFHINSIDDRNSDVVVLAIHGGLIEPNSDKVSKKLADFNTWNYYNFLGHGGKQCLKGFEDKLSENEKNFRRLHITSTHFNHQKAVDLVKAHPKSVAIHGYNPKRKYDPGVICVGGRNQAQINAFINHVNANSSTFVDQDGYKLQPINATDRKSVLCGGLEGTKKRNIVNRNFNGQGLQLELSLTMRADLANGTGQRYDILRDIIYSAIDKAMSV